MFVKNCYGVKENGLLNIMLVMFFVFHILVLIISFSKVASASRRANSPETPSFSKGNVQIPSFDDDSLQKASAFRTQKPMFQILRNLTELGSNNLKSNVFDKMLSDEMLSLKQKLYERDLIQASTANRVKQNLAATPTIQVQQKWSVVDLFTHFVFDETVTKSAEDENDVLISSDNNPESEQECDDLKHNNMTENKILELRSLPSVRHVGLDQNQAHGLSYANNNNAQGPPKCSCTRPDYPRCTHTDNNVAASYTVYPLYLQPFQTFVFSDSLDNPYQHVYLNPKVVDELKIPKKTKRRKTKPRPVDLYYDDNSKEIDDDEYISRPRPKRPNVIMNIDYDLVDDTPKKSDSKESDGKNFNLLNDLNEVFNDGVNKKCYCSQSTLILTKQGYALYIFMIVHTLHIIFS